MTSLMENVMALSNSGLMGVKPAAGLKAASWRLNAPPDILEETLRNTHKLIANVLDPSVRE